MIYISRNSFILLNDELEYANIDIYISRNSFILLNQPMIVSKPKNLH